MSNKRRIGVIFGGKSGEHDVSLMSATSILRAIDRDKYDVVMIGITREGRWLLYDGPVEAIAPGEWQAIAEKAFMEHPEAYEFSVMGGSGRTLKDLIDFALPILHGPNGEDGTVQGLFELMNIPYGGCSVIGAATAMDKIVAKKIFAAEGLLQTPYVALIAEDWMDEEKRKVIYEQLRKLSLPIFVKPANMGSSVGISKVRAYDELPGAIELAAAHDNRIVCEQGINCRELETSVIGNNQLVVGAVGEILPAAEYYDYKSKYYDAKSQLCIPADIPEEKRDELQDMARRAYKALGCQGYSRVDFLMDKDTQDIYINEINAIPGFTHASMFPLLCNAVGISYPEIVERIVELGYERYCAKNHG